MKAAIPVPKPDEVISGKTKQNRITHEVTSESIPEWLKFKMSDVGKNVKQLELLRCWWECKIVQSLEKTVGEFLKKLTYTHHITQ